MTAEVNNAGTPVRFGVSRLKPERKRGRNAREHQNGGAVIMAPPDDQSFHDLVKHAVGCQFPGWNLEGYALTEDNQHDPPAEAAERLRAAGMRKDAEECHNYGRGNNAFVGPGELASEVRRILAAAGYVRDAHQYRGHTNYTHTSGSGLAQLRVRLRGRAAGSVHLFFLRTEGSHE
jgi:hypothetical protein